MIAIHRRRVIRRPGGSPSSLDVRQQRMAMSQDRRRSHQVSHRRRSVALPLQIEAMEKRQLLATIVVNTTVDENNPADGTISLREAIALTNGTLKVADLSATEQALVF